VGYDDAIAVLDSWLGNAGGVRFVIHRHLPGGRQFHADWLPGRAGQALSIRCGELRWDFFLGEYGKGPGFRGLPK